MTSKAKLALASLGALTLALTMTSSSPTPFANKSLPRGLRNNNPLNLKKTAIKWQNEVVNTLDSVFESFGTLAGGLRAGIRNARTQYNRGNNTIAKLIYVWAPPSENNTANYIKQVVKATGIQAGQPFAWSDRETVAQIIYAISLHENGPIAAKYTTLDFVRNEVKNVG
jgi:hypothetical protein